MLILGEPGNLRPGLQPGCKDIGLGTAAGEGVSWSSWPRRWRVALLAAGRTSGC
jgi:hypothetical protein